MNLEDLELKQRGRLDIPTTGRYTESTFMAPNGWYCGHWHPTPEEAAVCLKAKLEARP